VHLTHKIALKPTAEQRTYFQRAAGTARFVWNLALAEWNRQYAAGQKPNANALKRQFNAIKYTEFPWLVDLHRDSHAQPFANLAKAWAKYFKGIREGREAHAPRFKKKGKSRDAFYVANDKFSIDRMTVKLPMVGRVAMREALRFDGKVMAASVSRTADRWFIAFQVDVLDAQFHRRRTGHGTVGVDLGLKAAATLSTGESIQAPKPLRAALRRLQLRQRRQSRKLEAAKAAMGLAGKKVPKGTRIPKSKNFLKSSAASARLHARIANVRADFLHKLTTRLCRENQVVVIEDLNVSGMLANEKLARAISDVGFYEFRRQLTYKAARYGTRLVAADRWFPSSRLCSACGWKNEALKLNDRAWTCCDCGCIHDRDVNAALNLKRLATETALPVASASGNGAAAAGLIPAAVGEVTPVRHETVSKTPRGRKKSLRTCA
jgi:putative transposase